MTQLKISLKIWKIISIRGRRAPWANPLAMPLTKRERSGLFRLRVKLPLVTISLTTQREKQSR